MLNYWGKYERTLPGTAILELESDEIRWTYVQSRRFSNR